MSTLPVARGGRRDEPSEQDHPYTFRNENAFLPADFRSAPDPAAYGGAFAEYALFYGLGVDGLFADNPDTALEARAEPVPVGAVPVGAGS